MKNQGFWNHENQDFWSPAGSISDPAGWAVYRPLLRGYFPIIRRIIFLSPPRPRPHAPIIADHVVLLNFLLPTSRFCALAPFLGRSPLPTSDTSRCRKKYNFRRHSFFSSRRDGDFSDALVIPAQLYVTLGACQKLGRKTTQDSGSETDPLIF